MNVILKEKKCILLYGMEGRGMMIWNGFGFLVLVITFVSSFLMELGVEAFTHNEFYYQEHVWPLSTVFIISGILCYLVSEALEKREKQEIYIEKRTGKQVKLNRKHSFFFIPLKYWSVILVVSGFGYQVFSYMGF